MAFVANRQHQLINAKQARVCGLGRDAVSGRVQRHQWRPLRRGVYLVAASQPSPEAKVLGAVLAGGESAVASHLTAAWVWRLQPRLPEVFDVTMLDARNPGDLPGVRVHRPRARIPERRVHRAIPVTSPVDTLIDLAASENRDRLEGMVAKAFADNLTTRAALAAAVQAAGKRQGIAALRAILATHPKLTRSQNERAFLRLVRAAELPEPQTNIVLEGKEVDAYWPDARLAVEVDAHATHGDLATFEDDHLLDADLAAAGLMVLRFTGAAIALVGAIGSVLLVRTRDFVTHTAPVTDAASPEAVHQA